MASLYRPAHSTSVSSTLRACQSKSRRPPPGPLRATISPPSWAPRGGVVQSTQRRGITQKSIQKMKAAEEQWEGWAQEIRKGQRQSFVSKLQERGFIHDVVGGDVEMLDKIITGKRTGLYAGVDPTAPSLHVGHLIPFMVLAWAYLHGLKAVFLLGGSTSKIGDPTGRDDARPRLNSTVRKANLTNMHMQMKKFGVSVERMGEQFGYQWEWAWRRALENNNTWWNKLSMLEVMDTMASNARLGTMLSRDNVKSRMSEGSGMSVAEFSYPIMQAWDYWHLYKKGVQIQVGGSDQYGNILFGCDMIKQIVKKDVTGEIQQYITDFEMEKPIGFTTPLLTTSAGEKLGKSAGNSIWLDKDMTPPYEFYQYFMRLPDEDMERYLKLFTFIPTSEVDQIVEEHNQNPSKRLAQQKLAANVTELIHGRATLQQVEKQTQLVFSPGSAGESTTSTEEKKPATDIMNPAVDKRAPQTGPFDVTPHLTLPRSLIVGQFFHKILYSAGMVSSKAEGFRLILKGGAHVGSQSDAKQTMSDALSFTPIKTWPAEVSKEFLIDDSLMILRAGKWKVKIIKVVSDEEFEGLGLTAPGWKEQTDMMERAKDREMFKNHQKIDGHWVKLPPIFKKQSPAEQGKPKIVHMGSSDGGDQPQNPGEENKSGAASSRS